MLAIAILSVRAVGPSAWSDARSLHAHWLVGQWRDGTGPVYSLPRWQQANDHLQAALRLTPGNAQLLDDLGFLNVGRAMGLGKPDAGTSEHALQQALFARAIVLYRAATTLRPTFPYTWAYLALAKHFKGEEDPELWLAFDKALRYGRNEAGAQPAMAQVAFAHWDELSPERKTQIAGMIKDAQPVPHKKLMELAEESGVVLQN
jgi:tetratricopeptide (TPR) repeat protein